MDFLVLCQGPSINFYFHLLVFSFSGLLGGKNSLFGSFPFCNFFLYTLSSIRSFKTVHCYKNQLSEDFILIINHRNTVIKEQITKSTKQSPASQKINIWKTSFFFCYICIQSHKTERLAEICYKNNLLLSTVVYGTTYCYYCSMQSTILFFISNLFLS